MDIKYIASISPTKPYKGPDLYTEPKVPESVEPYKSMLMQINISADLTREPLNELGRKDPYTKNVKFPLEESSPNLAPIEHPNSVKKQKMYKSNIPDNLGWSENLPEMDRSICQTIPPKKLGSDFYEMVEDIVDASLSKMSELCDESDIKEFRAEVTAICQKYLKG